jgi:hypothetical protein
MRTTWIPAIAALALVACNRAEDRKPDVARTDATPPAAIDGPPTTPPAPATPVPVGAAEKLIPVEAAMLAHVDLQGLSGSPLWAANRSLMDADPEVKKQLDALATCNMPLAGFKSLDLGVGADGLNVAAIVTGAGVGNVENLKCLEKQLTGEKFDVEEKDGRTRLVLDGGEAYGIPVADDTLAFVTRAWEMSVMDLVGGKGTPAREGALKDVLAQADTSKHVWFAGTVPPQVAALAATVPGGFSGMKSVSGSLDLNAGLALVLSFGMESADKASTTLAAVQKQFTDVKPMAGLLGVPATVVDKVRFAAKGDAVTMTASLTMDEITTMKASMDRARGDAAGAPPVNPALPGPVKSAPSIGTPPDGAPAVQPGPNADLPGDKLGAANDPTRSGDPPGSMQSGARKTPGSTSPTGASPTATGNGVPASDAASKQAGGGAK